MASPVAALKPAWQPGQSGNPKGRPKGSKNKLGEDFIKDVLGDWQEQGRAVIEKVREERPADYLKVVASLIPRDINFSGTDDGFDAQWKDLSDEELASHFKELAAELLDAAESTSKGQPRILQAPRVDC